MKRKVFAICITSLVFISQLLTARYINQNRNIISDLEISNLDVLLELDSAFTPECDNAINTFDNENLVDFITNDRDVLVLIKCKILGPHNKINNMDLSQSWISIKGLKLLIDSGSLDDLNCLNLTGLHLGNQAAKIIADAPQLSNLRVLILSLNQIDFEGVKSISQSEFLGSLEVLDVSKNAINRSGVDLIEKSPHLSNLIKLDTSNNLEPSK